MGHEFAGTITEVGHGVEGLRAGDRVTAASLYSCGRCDRCRDDLTQLCELVTTHGICSHGGGLSQYTVVPVSMLHRLPDGVSLAEGALIEPLSVAFGALRAQVGPPGSAVVLGGGPIGIGVTLGLRALGVENVVVVKPSLTAAASSKRSGWRRSIRAPTMSLLSFGSGPVAGVWDRCRRLRGCGRHVSLGSGPDPRPGPVRVVGHEHGRDWVHAVPACPV